MTQHLMSFYSFVWIYLQHFCKEIISFTINCVIEESIEIEFHSAVVFVDLVEFSSWEELTFCEKDMENDAGWKNITNWADFLSLDDFCYFGCDISWSSAAIEYVLWLIVECWESEICNHRLKTPFTTKHYVLGFDVSVHNTALMQLFESFRQSHHYLFDFRHW